MRKVEERVMNERSLCNNVRKEKKRKKKKGKMKKTPQQKSELSNPLHLLMPLYSHRDFCLLYVFSTFQNCDITLKLLDFLLLVGM